MQLQQPLSCEQKRPLHIAYREVAVQCVHPDLSSLQLPRPLVQVAFGTRHCDLESQQVLQKRESPLRSRRPCFVDTMHKGVWVHRVQYM